VAPSEHLGVRREPVEHLADVTDDGEVAFARPAVELSSWDPADELLAVRDGDERVGRSVPAANRDRDLGDVEAPRRPRAA
jgi:hypothetical protein